MSSKVCGRQNSPFFYPEIWYPIFSKITKEVVALLGPRIAALRRNANMSQAELAEMLKISASAVGMYEQGRREPSLDTVVKLTGAVQTRQEAYRVRSILEESLEFLDVRLDRRQLRPFSRQELMMLMAAMLTEP